MLSRSQLNDVTSKIVGDDGGFMRLRNEFNLESSLEEDFLRTCRNELTARYEHQLYYFPKHPLETNKHTLTKKKNLQHDG